MNPNACPVKGFQVFVGDDGGERRCHSRLRWPAVCGGRLLPDRFFPPPQAAEEALALI